MAAPAGAILRGGITQAYMVGSEAKQPELSFAMVPHEDVQVVGARIGLAETMLVLDANGAYRAAAAFRMNNATEQFLEVELPEGAELWTAVVADQPVKPIWDRKAADSRRVSIPLVKTAAGDLDYAVTLKYGGKIDALGRIGSVDFPLIHTNKINVERSVVQLHLPENYRWLHFGGTMHPGADATVTAAVLSYQTDQLERLMEAAKRSDPFVRERAKNNMKQFGLAIGQVREHMGDSIGRNAKAKGSADQRRSAKSGRRVPGAGGQGRRSGRPEAGVKSENVLLNASEPTQDNSIRARNVVGNMDLNFDGNKDLGAASQAPASQPEGQFNPQWFANNDIGANAPAYGRMAVNGWNQTAGPGGPVAANAPAISPITVNVGSATAAPTDQGVQSSQFGATFTTRAGGTVGEARRRRRPLRRSRPTRASRKAPADEKSLPFSQGSWANTSGKSADQQEEVHRYQQKLQQQQSELGRGENAVGVNSYSGAANINAGTMVLTGSNTYSGGTTVNGGLGTQATILDGTAAKGDDKTAGFHVYAGLTQSGGTADNYSTTVQPLMDKAMTGVARGSNAPGSALGPHSLLESTDGSGKTTESWGVPTGTTTPAVQPAGLASLDFQLPEGGQVYYFIAPAGNRDYGRGRPRRLPGETGLPGRRPGRRDRDRLGAPRHPPRRHALVGRPPAAALMVCLGALAIVTGLLPAPGPSCSSAGSLC